MGGFTMTISPATGIMTAQMAGAINQFLFHGDPTIHNRLIAGRFSCDPSGLSVAYSEPRFLGGPAAWIVRPDGTGEEIHSAGDLAYPLWPFRIQPMQAAILIGALCDSRHREDVVSRTRPASIYEDTAIRMGIEMLVYRLDSGA